MIEDSDVFRCTWKMKHCSIIIICFRSRLENLVNSLIKNICLQCWQKLEFDQSFILDYKGLYNELVVE